MPPTPPASSLQSTLYYTKAVVETETTARNRARPRVALSLPVALGVLVGGHGLVASQGLLTTRIDTGSPASIAWSANGAHARAFARGEHCTFGRSQSEVSKAICYFKALSIR